MYGGFAGAEQTKAMMERAKAQAIEFGYDEEDKGKGKENRGEGTDREEEARPARLDGRAPRKGARKSFVEARAHDL